MRNKGFSLLEIVISTLILITFTALILSASTYIRRRVVFQEHQHIALALAQYTLEELISEGYSALAEGYNQSFALPANSDLANLEGEIEYDVIQNGVIREITVTVSWTEPEQTTSETQTLSTWITE